MYDSGEVFGKFPSILIGEPTKQGVIREKYILDVSIDPNQLANATQRNVYRTFGTVPSTSPDIAFTDFVCICGPKEMN